MNADVHFWKTFRSENVCYRFGSMTWTLDFQISWSHCGIDKSGRFLIYENPVLKIHYYRLTNVIVGYGSDHFLEDF